MLNPFIRTCKSPERYLPKLLIGFSLLSLSGCGAVAGITQELTSRTIDWILEPSPTNLELKYQATTNLNPDLDGRASPLIVRFYELKSTDVFANADFFALYNDDTNILGNDLQYREEMKFKPGEHREFTLEAKPETRFIAVFAAFRDLETAQWRTSIAIPLHETTPVSIHFSSKVVTMTIPVDD